MRIDEVREYRRLLQENARLKKLLADRELGDRRHERGDANNVLKPQQRHAYVVEMKKESMSERRSCQLIGIARSS